MTRILIAEDEVRIATFLEKGLSASGFATTIVGDGILAGALARDSDYDLLLLDLGLPGQDGLAALAEIRSRRESLPIIVLTARDAISDRVAGLNGGADDYLTKPFSFVVLVARLRALLRRGAPQRPSVLAVGDLHLDPASRQVSRGSVEIALTAREFALLEFLMRRAGQTVSKTEALAHVWDAHLETDLNLVEVYVGYVRRKIDTPFGRKTLQTVRGAGYRLTDEP